MTRSPARDGVGLERLKARIGLGPYRGFTVREMAKRFGVQESTIRRALSEMMADGLVASVGTVKEKGATGRPRTIYALQGRPRG